MPANDSALISVLADEESDETYLGLARDDFEQDPYRRYSSSQLDNMSWDHQQYQFTHIIAFYGGEFGSAS